MILVRKYTEKEVSECRYNVVLLIRIYLSENLNNVLERFLMLYKSSSFNYFWNDVNDICSSEKYF